MTAVSRPVAEDLRRLLDDLADELRRSVVVNDPLVHVLCTSRHFGDEDELRIRAVLQHDAGAEASRFILGQGVTRWPGAGMLTGNRALGMRPRLCVPLREHGELLGLLMVIDAGHTLTPAETTRIEEVSRVAAALLHQDRLSTDDGRQARDRALLQLLGPDAADRDRAMRTVAGDGPLADAAHSTVTVVQLNDPAVPEAELEAALRSVLESATRHQSQRLQGVVDHGRAVLVRTAQHLDRGELAEQAGRMAAGLEQLCSASGSHRTAVAGIGDPAPGLRSAWRSYAQAKVAARGATLLRDAGPVAEWAALGEYAVVLQLPDSALTPALVPEPVARLLDDHKRPHLAETLRAYLEHGCSISRTAEALHLHRTSLYYRLDQIRAVVGLDLDDGANRLLLHQGLLLADLIRPPGR